MFISICLATVLGGLGLLILALGQRRSSLESTHWPTAQAIILASDVVLHPGMSGGNPAYQAYVNYDYEVDGRTYHGNCISVGLTPESTRAHPDTQVLRYAPGSVAQVRHHPTEPGRAVLETHPRGAGLGAAVLGVLLVGAGCAAAVLVVLGSTAGTI